MRIFLAGASGVIGQRLVPLLVAAGHEVVGSTRSPDKAGMLADLGATPVVCDVYDLDGLVRVFTEQRPEVVLHQLTDLPDDPRHVGEFAAANARVRIEGTRNLITASAAAPVRRVIAQSIAWELSGHGAAATASLEDQVLATSGVILRYGRFYGPGTHHEDSVPEAPRVHVDEAARRSLFALDAPSGVYVIAEE